MEGQGVSNLSKLDAVSRKQSWDSVPLDAQPTPQSSLQLGMTAEFWAVGGEQG